MLRLLLGLEKIILKLESLCLSTSLIGLLVISCFQVILRNSQFLREVIHADFGWIDPVSRHAVLWITFLGGAITTAKMRHLTIDVLSKFLPKRLEKGIRIVILLFAVTVTYLLTRASLVFLASEKEFGGTLVGDIPTWIFEVIIPVGFGLILFHFAIRLIEAFFPRAPQGSDHSIDLAKDLGPAASMSPVKESL